MTIWKVIGWFVRLVKSDMEHFEEDNGVKKKIYKKVRKKTKHGS